MGKEIKRKFRIHEIPSQLDLVSCKYIDQNYLVNGEEEIRVRKTTSNLVYTDYKLTLKRGVGLEREEIETSISHETYMTLIELIKTVPIRKKRYEYTDEDNTYTIDVFENVESNLILVEIEFASVEEAKNFNPPSWLDKEVTSVDSYYNKELWKAINGTKIEEEYNQNWR